MASNFMFLRIFVRTNGISLQLHLFLELFLQLFVFLFICFVLFRFVFLFYLNISRCLLTNERARKNVDLDGWVGSRKSWGRVNQNQKILYEKKQISIAKIRMLS